MRTILELSLLLCLFVGLLVNVPKVLPPPQDSTLGILYWVVLFFGGWQVCCVVTEWIEDRFFPLSATKTPIPPFQHDTTALKIPSLHDTTTLDLNLEQDQATLKRLLQDDTTMFGGYPPDWDDIRQRVLQRDGYRCGNCGTHIGVLHVHHIVPLSRGGTNNLSNLRTLCEDCHTLIHPHMR